MTTNRKPTTCTDCGTPLSTRNRTSDVCGTLPGSYDDLCVTCYDGCGDDTPVATPVVTGRTNMSHAACAHPRTPAGRAACRATRG